TAADSRGGRGLEDPLPAYPATCGLRARNGTMAEAATKPAGKLTAAAIAARKGAAEPLAVVTAYDVAFARLADQAGADVVLVGDSLGMVVQGHTSTLPVTLDEMVYHTRAVARGVVRAHLVADMPFMSYQASL